MDKNIPEIMTIEDVADYLRVSERTIYDWAQKGKIPAGKLGTSWRFRREDILNWISNKLNNAIKKEDNFVPLLLKDILKPENIIICDKANKSEILHQLINILSEMPEVNSKDDVATGIFHRELLMSTGIGMGIAIPHARLDCISSGVMAAALVRGGISDYESMDNNPIKLIFMILVAKGQHTEHLKLVSQLSLKLKDEERRVNLINSKNTNNFFDILIN